MANRFKILHNGMGVVSSSAQIDFNDIQNKPASVDSASYAATASVALNVALPTGSTKWGTVTSNTHQFTGSLGVTGSMTVMGGNVGIGTSNPTARIDAGVTSSAQAPVLNLRATGTSAEGHGAAISFFHATTERTYRIYGYATGWNRGALLFARGSSTGYTNTMTLNQDGAVRFHAYGAGTLITDSSGNITATSDGRMKDVSGSFDRGLDAIINLSPKVYHWKEESGLNTEDVNVGLIAQEVESVIPEAVFVKDDRYTISDRPIISALINAIKELSARVVELEAKLK